MSLFTHRLTAWCADPEAGNAAEMDLGDGEIVTFSDIAWEKDGQGYAAFSGAIKGSQAEAISVALASAPFEGIIHESSVSGLSVLEDAGLTRVEE